MNDVGAEDLALGDGVLQAFPPVGIPEIAVVGSVASVEEAMQMHQMRFILMWALRLETLARPRAPA